MTMPEPLPLIDSHCHIDFDVFDSHRHELLERCGALGMLGVLVPGVTRCRWKNLKLVCDQSEMLFPCFGLHPCFMSSHCGDDLDALPQMLEQGAVAVGEIGLDALTGRNNLDQQISLFEAQLKLAQQMKLPVIVHARKTHDLIAKSVRKLRFQQGGIVHAFSGSLQQAQVLVSLGFKLGFGGAATYERAHKLRSIFRALGDEDIVLETDAPDIPPAFAKNQPNSPENLSKITEILAEIRHCSGVELAKSTSCNVMELFSLKLERSY